MITFKKPTTNDAFAVISKAGAYKGRLIALRKSLQDEKYAKDKDNNPVEPKELVSFVFDIINKEGLHCHVATKPSTFSFTDKSNLPAVWSNVVTLGSDDDFNDFFYDKDGKLKDFFGLLNVSAVDKEGKVYNTVTSVVQELDEKDLETSELSDYDLKVYGKPCIEYELAKGYADQAPTA